MTEGSFEQQSLERIHAIQMHMRTKTADSFGQMPLTGLGQGIPDFIYAPSDLRPESTQDFGRIVEERAERHSESTEEPQPRLVPQQY